MRVIGYRPQRTLAASVELKGVGFITGARVHVRFRPAPPDTGILFRRVDRAIAAPIPACTDFVTDTQRRTTIGPPEAGVTLVEHLLAALAGLRIDNCEVELDGPEPPGFDGSSRDFVAALAAAGTETQLADRPILAPAAPILATAGSACIAIHPAAGDGLRASYLLDYGVFSPIAPQRFTLDVCPAEFAREAAPCRTFVTEEEAHQLRAQGIGRHLSAADLVVFGSAGPIDNRLRFADEPARHKLLDLIGDLALCGFDLAGHVVAYRSGHALNVELARKLTAAARLQSNEPNVATASSRAA